MKKKGITLIELIIAMSIAFLLLGVVDGIFISRIKNYKKIVLENTGFNYLNEALAIIDKEVNSNSNNVVAVDNVIKVEYFDGTTLNNIKYINGCIYVLYGTMFSAPIDSSPKNIIIDGVKSFIATRSGGLLYIKITLFNNQSIERCLSIENAN